jgi:hypothetical protein
MEEPRRSQLTEDLRRDPQLRERYATVRRVDDLMRRAITDENVLRRPHAGAGARLRVPAVAAAGFLILVSAAWWFMRYSQPSGEVQVLTVKAPGRTNEAVQPEYHPIRVVFSCPVRTASRQAGDNEDARSPLESGRQVVTVGMREDADFLLQLDRALGAGRIEDTLGLLREASEDQRAAGFRYMGELVRSASVAERILDRLSPHEQVAVCGQWARKPVVRPLAFERLRRWSMQAELSEEVRVVVSKLAEDPALRSWLRSYRLHGGDGAGSGVSS